MKYPTRTNRDYHIIPVGDYLISKTVAALPRDVAISAFRLVDYSSICEGVFFAKMRCVTKATFDVQTNAGPKTINLAVDPIVGAAIIVGDIAPPFTLGDNFVDEIHNMARRAIDALQVEMQKAFALLPRKTA